MHYEDINNFLISNYNSSELIKVIDITKIRSLTIPLQKEIDNDYYLNSILMSMVQKKRNEVFLSEIEKIIAFGQHENDTIVFFKGIFLAADLYDAVEHRTSGDIDILIKPEFFCKLYFYLLDQDFLCEDIPYNCKDLSVYINKLIYEHICFYKTVHTIEIRIEVHGSVVNAGSLFHEMPAEFVTTATPKKLLNMTPYVLKPEYNIITMMLHFFKHLPKEFLHSYMFGMELEIKISNLYDIVLLIKKYKHTIDWNLIISICKEMYIVRYIKIVATLINRIFGTIFSNDFLQSLESNLSYSKMHEIPYELYGLGKFMWLYDQLEHCILECPLHDLLLGKLEDYFPLQHMAILDTTNLSPQRNFSNCFTLENFSCQNSNCVISIHANASDDHLHINFQVNHKICCPYKNEGFLFHYDGIEILVIHKDHLEHYMYTLSYSEGYYFLLETSQNSTDLTGHKITQDDFVHKISIAKDGFQISLDIPWSYLHINPYSDTVVPFNIGGLISHPKTRTFTGNYKLFDNGGDFFNFCNTGYIKF